MGKLPMNKHILLFNLQEAREELEHIIAALSTETDYDEHDFRAAMEHAYHHLNTAWNARHASDECWANQADELFHPWRAFPEDIDLAP
jgi:hypothetical protein